jgi:hypothetical protein
MPHAEGPTAHPFLQGPDPEPSSRAETVSWRQPYRMTIVGNMLEPPNDSGERGGVTPPDSPPSGPAISRKGRALGVQTERPGERRMSRTPKNGQALSLRKCSPRQQVSG